MTDPSRREPQPALRPFLFGAAAPVAHATTGVRVRDYPITLDKLLEQMPDVG